MITLTMIRDGELTTRQLHNFESLVFTIMALEERGWTFVRFVEA